MKVQSHGFGVFHEYIGMDGIVALVSFLFAFALI